MTPILTTALFLGAIAPWIRAFLWRVPFSFLTLRMVLVTSLGTAFVAFALGLVVDLFIPATAPYSGYSAALLAGTAVLALTFVRERRNRHLRGAFLLAQLASDKDAATRAIARLKKNFQKDLRSGRSMVDLASEVFVVITPVTSAGHWGAAVELLEGVESEDLPRKHQALRAQSLATCLIRMGEVERAQTVLRTAATDAGAASSDRVIERWNQSLEALLAAVEGDADRAERLLARARDGEEDASLHLSQALVEAHVLASRERHGEAEKKLRSLLNALGPAALDQALEPRGPASAIAERLLKEQRAQ